MQNTEDQLTRDLDACQDVMERSRDMTMRDAVWFRLAVVAVRCLILIASSRLDQDRNQLPRSIQEALNECDGVYRP